MSRPFLPAILFLSLFGCVVSARAQTTLPRYGQDFSFGIIEGAQKLDGGTDFYPVTLTVMSAFNGEGGYSSPAGQSGTFTFVAGQPTVIQLPQELIQINDLGKTKKGIRVHTSAPVNLVLHDMKTDAGDATQLYPDAALDTSYVVSDWGLWNDQTENNHTEFLVTAIDDNTIVRITPTVMTMLEQAAGVEISATLMRGESYIVKADSSAKPLISSLSGSLIHSNKAVSVIAGVSCAYVPAAMQSCNELMDELIGKKWWGTKFFVQPLSSSDTMYYLIITSDTTLTGTFNGTLQLIDHRAVIGSNVPGAIVLSAPAEVHQLTEGSSRSATGLGDPTMVSILPVNQYSDTLLWDSEGFSTGDTVSPLFLSLIYSSSEGSHILLDGKSLTTRTEPRTSFPGTDMSAIRLQLPAGAHRLESSLPVFAVATGFNLSDAYSFIPGGAPFLPSMSANNSKGTSAFNFSFYPNPVENELQVFSQEPINEITMFDLLGRQAKSVIGVAIKKVDVSAIPPGVYTLVASSKKGMVAKRVQIIH